MSFDIGDAAAFLHRTEEREADIHPEPARLLLATLDRSDRNLAAGSPLPLLWHWLYFPPTIRPIRTMLNHATTEVFFDDLEVPAENLIGIEGHGFRHILDGMNAERILIAAECIGDARWFIAKATDYAKSRIVFDRPIGQNQGVQFPIARAYAASEAADLMVQRAAALYDAGESCAKEANMAKLLAADASWQAADMCLQTHGGFGFASEYDIERKFRETRLYQVAPISTNLILAYLAEHLLGLPRSY